MQTQVTSNVITSSASPLQASAQLPAADVLVRPPVAEPLRLLTPSCGHFTRSASRAIPAAKAVAMFDTAAAVIALTIVVLATNRHRMVMGIDAFLTTRITLKNVALLAALVAAWPRVLRLCGLFDVGRTRRLHDELARVALGCCAGTLLVVPFALTSGSHAFGPGDVALFLAAATAASSCVRLVRRSSLTRQRQRTCQRVIVVGSGSQAQRLLRQLSNDDKTTYEVLGFIDSTVDEISVDGVHHHKLGGLGQLEEILMRQPVDELFVTLPVKSHYHVIQDVIEICERVGVRVTYGAAIFNSSLAEPRLGASNGTPLVTMHSVPDDERVILKRVIDLAGALVGLIVLLPLTALIALGIKLTSRGPVIYAQDRYGLNKRLFRMYKFRTMVADAERQQQHLESCNEADGPVFKIKNDPRVTRIGRFLRRTSLDELPQLLNVVRGEMSLVGPRPLPLRDVQRFSHPSDMRRFSVRPGLTCLWQISGRSNIGFSEWIRLDLEYIDRWSLLLDVRILIKTFPAVFRGTGAS